MIEKFIELLKAENFDFNSKINIFDVGSRDGLQSIEFYQHFPNANIYAFECNPNTIEICYRNCSTYDRIKVINIAVNSYDGECSFYPINKQKTQTTWEDGNPGASSLFISNGTYSYEYYVQDEIKVKCSRLDTLIKQHQIGHVDLIWMDLQGAELIALQSLGDYLKDVQYIYTEVTFKEMYTGQSMFTDIDNYLKKNIFFSVKSFANNEWQSDIIYKNYIFDIVIPVGPSDFNVIQEQIKFTKKNIIGYRKIYLVVPHNFNLVIDNVTQIDESIFPFLLDNIEQYGSFSHDRRGWYLQQLIKLYSSFFIPNILPNYLVIDSDTFFLKPTTFVSDGKYLYNYGTENHRPYFYQMARMHPQLQKVSDQSGICHHMFFEKKFIAKLFELVEKYHNQPFWQVFLKCVDSDNSGASEYEIYYNFMLKFYPDEIRVRPLNWINVTNKKLLNEPDPIYDYCSYHYYSRE